MRGSSLVSAGVPEGRDLFVAHGSKKLVVVVQVGSKIVVRGRLKVHIVSVWVISQLLFLVSLVLEPVLHLGNSSSLKITEQRLILISKKELIIAGYSVSKLHESR
jgi:hypothetical protein